MQSLLIPHPNTQEINLLAMPTGTLETIGDFLNDPKSWSTIEAFLLASKKCRHVVLTIIQRAQVLSANSSHQVLSLMRVLDQLPSGQKKVSLDFSLAEASLLSIPTILSQSFASIGIKNKATAQQIIAHADLQTTQKLVRDNPFLLKYSPFKDNFQVVLTAVEIDGEALFHAHKSLQANYEIVLAAVNQNGLALEFAHEDLKNNFTIVKTAINSDLDALDFASPALQEQL